MNEMPTWEGFLIPVLRVMQDGVVRHRREFQPMVADAVGLTPDQREELLPSGMQVKYENRIGWAVSYLANVGAMDRPKRGEYSVTDAGREVLRRFPEEATERVLEEYAALASSPIRPYQSSGPRNKRVNETEKVETTELTPIEQVQAGISRIQEEVGADLLRRLQGNDPGFFEDAVVELLLAMGYGGTGGKGKSTQRSHDGGIDGVIDQDVLGIRRVYLQAKRYADANTVGRQDLQAFVGALSGKADSGVFITTSRFSNGARQYAEAVPTRIILIDGERLTELMIKYRVGVQVEQTFTAVKIDEDFFA